MSEERHINAAAAKTVNLPATTSVEDVQDAFWRAWRTGLKGITGYRSGSRPDPVPHAFE